MKKLSLALLIGFSLVLIAGGAFAATSTDTLIINAVVQDAATLTIDETAINFPASNPDTTPNIPNAEGAIDVSAKVRVASAAVSTLTHQAAGPLSNGSDTIAINNVSWTASGTGYVPGTMSSSAPVSAGSFTGPGDKTGSFSYSLVNSWLYPVGTYTVLSTYTLTTP
jgi:hypothetical protein